VRLGEVETVEHTRDKSLGLTVYFGQRSGSASTTDFSPAAVQDTVRAACAIARHTAEDPAAGLADPACLARQVPDLDLYHPWAPGIEELVDAARHCEDVARAEDKRIVNSEGASISTYEGIEVYGNTHGFVGSVPSTRHSLSASLVAQDDSGMQRDYSWTVARRSDGLEASDKVGREAAQRTLRRLGARKLSTRRSYRISCRQCAAGRSIGKPRFFSITSGSPFSHPSCACTSSRIWLVRWEAPLSITKV
jgi:PmbA protein